MCVCVFDCVSVSALCLMRVYVQYVSVAYAGFVQRGGFNHAGPEKADDRAGGLRHIFFLFFSSFTLLGRGTVHLPDRKKKKKNPISKGGGGGVEPPEPPIPCVRAWYV